MFMFGKEYVINHFKYNLKENTPIEKRAKSMNR